MIHHIIEHFFQSGGHHLFFVPLAGLFGIGESSSNQVNQQTNLSSAGANSPVLNNSTVTISNPDVAAVANGAIQAVKGVAVSGQNALASALSDSQGALSNYASGGQTNNNNTLLYLVGIVACVIGGIYIFIRGHK